jgi:hypothetical protein
MPLSAEITAKQSLDLSDQNTGLGNVIAQIASVIGIAHYLNRPYMFPYAGQWARILRERYNFDHDVRFLRNIPVTDPGLPIYNVNPDPNCAPCTWDTNAINQASNISDDYLIMINGYLGCNNYYEPVIELLRKWFGPDEEAILDWYTKYPELNDDTTPCISMHLRYKHYQLEQPIEIIHDSIRKTLEKIGKPCNLFVFSNDSVQATRDTQFQHPLLKKLHIIEPNKLDYLDLWGMTLCQYHILSLSTFSWWSAVLSKKENKRIFYTKYFYSVYPRSLMDHHYYSYFECLE